MKNKNMIIEILVIVAFAVGMGYFYNSLIPKPLPLDYKPIVPIALSNDELFGAAGQKIDSSVQNNKPATIEIVPETPAIPQKDTLKKKPVEIPTAKSPETLLNIKTKTVTYEQMLKIKDNANFIVIDARRNEMYAKAHIGKAINIFPEDEESVYMNKLLELPKDKTIVIYCDGGQCELSHHVAEALANLGYSRVFIYTGGWEEWSKRGGK